MKIREFLKRPFPFLDSPKHRWILVFFCLSFGVFFINVFVPFNINRWNKDSGFDEFLTLSGFGIIAALVLIFSQFGLRKVFGITHFSIGTFFIWAFFELLLMSVLFIFYQSGWNVDFRRFLSDMPDSFKYTLLSILIPYSLVILFLSLVMQKSRISQLSEKSTNQESGTNLINFPDEKGTVRFSIAVGKILYVESADNYVIIYYLNDHGSAKQILRNSMKKTEEILRSTSLQRCHRSFMVNCQKIEFVEYEKTKCRVKLVGIDNFIPVSQKFYPAFKNFANR